MCLLEFFQLNKYNIIEYNYNHDLHGYMTMDLKIATLTLQTGFMYCGRIYFLLKLLIHKLLEDKMSIYLGDKLLRLEEGFRVR